MPDDQSPIRAELNRIGASFRKAGAAGYIDVTQDEDAARLVRRRGVRRRRPAHGLSGRQLLGPSSVHDLDSDDRLQAVPVANRAAAPRFWQPFGLWWLG